MREKAAYYLANGAQQVWLIFTKKPLIEVMYPNGESDFLLSWRYTRRRCAAAGV
jgi:hypothetical protein